MGSRDPSLDDRPAREIEDLRERAERAERERDQAQREHDRLPRENDRRRQQIDHLKRQVDEARRAGFRQVTRVAVRQCDVYVGRCDRCGHRVQGRHPLQTSDAIGAAAAQLGRQVIALVVVLNKQLGLSFGTIVTLLRQRYGLTVTRSGLVHAVHRAARQARPTYDALCAQVRGSPMVTERCPSG